MMISSIESKRKNIIVRWRWTATFYCYQLLFLFVVSTFSNIILFCNGQEQQAEANRFANLRGGGPATVMSKASPNDNNNSFLTEIVRKEEMLEIIVLVMGEAAAFETWYDNLKVIDKDTTNLVLVYASYDQKVANTSKFHREKVDSVQDGEFVDFDTIYIKGTTWTQGRNLLAAEALRKEKLHGKTFDYWYFIDDDIEPTCHPATDTVFGKGSCWQKVFNFLASSAVPEKTSTVTIGEHLKYGLTATSNVNAHNAAFRRSHVPYLLPYATIQTGLSEWISQAANFCIVNSCMPNTVVFIPLIHVENPKHRDYPKYDGYDVFSIGNTIKENFHDESIHFTPCKDWNRMYFYQEGEHLQDTSKQVLGPYQSSVDLNKHMNKTNISYCTPIRNRFTEWEEKVLA